MGGAAAGTEPGDAEKGKEGKVRGPGRERVPGGAARGKGGGSGRRRRGGRRHRGEEGAAARGAETAEAAQEAGEHGVFPVQGARPRRGRLPTRPRVRCRHLLPLRLHGARAGGLQGSDRRPRRGAALRQVFHLRRDGSPLSLVPGQPQGPLRNRRWLPGVRFCGALPQGLPRGEARWRRVGADAHRVGGGRQRRRRPGPGGRSRGRQSPSGRPGPPCRHLLASRRPARTTTQRTTQQTTTHATRKLPENTFNK